MDWRSRFNAAFFSAWQGAGLPQSDRYARCYDEIRCAADVPDGLLGGTPQNDGPLADAMVRDVYAFGVFIGHITGRLLALPANEVHRAADWCGRFNVGISLFDYLSDQAQPEDLLQWSRFARLAHGAPASRRGAAAKPRSEAAQALDRVAGDVMSQLEAVVGPLDRQPVDAMWVAFGDMMQAELLMARAQLSANADVDRLAHAARTKSTGPFCCMAEWISLNSRRADVALRAQARALGTAIGDCFWLVDDARDLWEDLDAGRWNLFLLTAARTDPALLADREDPSSEIRLSRMLMTRGWVEPIVAPVIEKARDVFQSMPAPAAARDEVAGVLGVSMERWLR